MGFVVLRVLGFWVDGFRVDGIWNGAGYSFFEVKPVGKYDVDMVRQGMIP